MHNVPQFLDVEDKIVGPLTAKQLGWLAGAGVILFILWNFLDFSAFVIAGLFTVALFSAFAFFRPNGQSFLFFLISMVFFFFRPKIYVWKRDFNRNLLLKKVPPRKKEPGEKIREKVLKRDKIEELSRLLDSREKTWRY